MPAERADNACSVRRVTALPRAAQYRFYGKGKAVKWQNASGFCMLHAGLTIFPLRCSGFFIIIGKNLPEVKELARLSDPITMLKGIGPAKAKQFANLNIFTLRDLICHFPRGYEDRTKLVPIEKLEPDVPACFKAMVMNTPRTAHVRKGLDITKVQVADHTGRLNVTFFNNRYVSDQLVYGREYIFYGAVSGDYA